MENTNSSSGPFTIHNLPYGIISDKQNDTRRCATAYGNFAIDLNVLHGQVLFKDISELNTNVFDREHLNAFAALPSSVRGLVRSKLKEYLSSATSHSYPAFVPLADVENHFPMDTRNFSDFYCSLEHTHNCSSIVNLDIKENWFTIPSVYNGRTSSLVVSGTPVTRPCGVFPRNPRDSTSPKEFLPETQLDFELEMGVFLSKPVPRGQRLEIADAAEHIFGFVILNDWSARMIQFFEMQPLGPFHGKGSGTSISSWIVTREALNEIGAACPRGTGPQEPAPLKHLTWPVSEGDKATYDIDLNVRIIRGGKSYQICSTNLNELHWTPYQQLTHLSSAGSGLSTGDIFGTGTISSSRTNSADEKTGLACLWERKLPRCSKLSTLPEGLVESLLLDGDEVVMEGWCRDKKTGETLLGFGECRGRIEPAVLPH